MKKIKLQVDYLEFIKLIKFILRRDYFDNK